MTRKKVKEVRGSLHSFIVECGRFTKTSGFHYKVRDNKIVHEKWTCYFSQDSLRVEGIDGQTLQLKNLRRLFVNSEEVDAIRPIGDYIFTTSAILNLVKEAIATWYIAKFFNIEYADTLLRSTG